MDNRNKFWKGVLVGALVTAFAGLIIIGMAAGIWVVGRGVMRNQAYGIADHQATPSEVTLDVERISQKMELIQGIIKERYLFDEDPEMVEDGIFMGMMAGLGDPYSSYYTEEDFQDLMDNSINGEYCGIGALISQNRQTMVMEIMRVFDGTPSAKAGMLPGDMITAVDGENVVGMELDLVVNNYIKGEADTEVTVTVYRESTEEYLDLVMTREKIETPTVEHEMLEDHIGYVLVSQFEGVTAEQFIAAVEDLESQGMEKMIIDLRNNPGGLLDAAVEMAAYLLPDGTIVRTEYKNGTGDEYFSKDGELQASSTAGTRLSQYPIPDDHELDIPMVILVNGNSASASEVFAGAMRDYDRAELVGTTTFGKGIVQSVIPFTGGDAIKLTTAHYFTPDGFDLHGKGLEPDVEVELDGEMTYLINVDPENDNQIRTAVETLKEME
ncbi:carboxyl-terminal protease [Lachnoclostridium sp. An14]|uniref:S41 family peptidase n=1 Tax=Lachnoclostridium sp. An14 TaxID=1965562 RepID=UPI000B392A12|nr:S41 family peptidase [Lachnoclostridium sp. An14]OUQ15388.1 carboxyl-terminal protease [Lachnoclostridium sp. An14]